MNVALNPGFSVSLNLKELGGVRFSELKVGDLLYSNTRLARIVRLTPKRAYVETVRVVPDALRYLMLLPGSREFNGSSGSGYYVDEYGTFVVLPNEDAYNAMLAEHARHDAAIKQAEAMLRACLRERAFELARIITDAKGLPTIKQEVK